MAREASPTVARHRRGELYERERRRGPAGGRTHEPRDGFGSDSDSVWAGAGDLAPPDMDMDEYWRLPSTWRGGFRALLALDCVRVLQRRWRELDEFKFHAGSLEEDNMNKVDLTKDRQEMAIYAFTIVTVVFLPLSAVASIFGMNTSDLRDMEEGQWLYWAAAVPVTVFVIVIGLWWMGELGNAVGWLLPTSLRRNWWGGGGAFPAAGGSAYAFIPPPPQPPAAYEPGDFPQRRMMQKSLFSVGPGGVIRDRRVEEAAIRRELQERKLREREIAIREAQLREEAALRENDAYPGYQSNPFAPRMPPPPPGRVGSTLNHRRRIVRVR